MLMKMNLQLVKPRWLVKDLLPGSRSAQTEKTQAEKKNEPQQEAAHTHRPKKPCPKHAKQGLPPWLKAPEKKTKIVAWRPLERG